MGALGRQLSPLTSSVHLRNPFRGAPGSANGLQLRQSNRYGNTSLFVRYLSCFAQGRDAASAPFKSSSASQTALCFVHSRGDLDLSVQLLPRPGGYRTQHEMTLVF